MLIAKPLAGEYPALAKPYIELVPDDGQLLSYLHTDLVEQIAFVQTFSEREASLPHLYGEWTIKEIMVHLIDDERVFAYRSLRFARLDATALPGFDELAFVANSRANERPVGAILNEYAAVRQATVALFESFSAEDLIRIGEASGGPLSVRAAGYHICGHSRHHIESIHENYGP